MLFLRPWTQVSQPVGPGKEEPGPPPLNLDGPYLTPHPHQPLSYLPLLSERRRGRPTLSVRRLLRQAVGTVSLPGGTSDPSYADSDHLT